MRITIGILLLVLGPLSMVHSPALAKDSDDRIKALEEKWSQYEASKIDQNSKLAEAISQIDKLKTDIQALGGGSEAQNVQMKQMQEGMERHYRDLEMRLNAVEGQLKLLQDQLNRAIASVAPKIAQEGKEFQKGLDLIQKGEYAQAIAAFQQFSKQYPKSPMRDDAVFWIAECRYSMKDYSQAIKDYQKFVEQFPKSVKAPSAVLKQGDSFVNLQMKEEAKVFYKKLIQDYSKSEEAAQAQGKLAALEKPGTSPLPTPVPTPAVPSIPTPVPAPAPAPTPVTTPPPAAPY